MQHMISFSKLLCAVLSTCVCLRAYAQDTAHCPPAQSVELAKSQLDRNRPIDRGSAALASGLKLLDKRTNAPIFLARGVSQVQIQQSHVLSSQEMNSLKSQLGSNLIPTSAAQISLLLNVYSQTWGYLNNEIQGMSQRTPEAIGEAWLSDRQLLLDDLKSHGFQSFESARTAIESDSDALSQASALITALSVHCSAGRIRDTYSDYSNLISQPASPAISTFLSQNSTTWTWLRGTVAQLQKEDDIREASAAAEKEKEQAERDRLKAIAEAEARAVQNAAKAKELAATAVTIHNELQSMGACPCEQVQTEIISSYPYGRLRALNDQLKGKIAKLKTFRDKATSSASETVRNDDPVLSLMSPSDMNRLQLLHKQLALAQVESDQLQEFASEVQSNLQPLVDLGNYLIGSAVSIVVSEEAYEHYTFPIFSKSAAKQIADARAKTRKLRPKLDARFWSDTEQDLSNRLDIVSEAQGLRIRQTFDELRR